ncbi:MAG TPA: hypothetical protein VHP83_16245 [Aggregatilineaceae bacterium]|nr:hypothetical protein [Aggregatilineaceae bacterium]
MNTYVTLAQLRRYLGLAPTQTADDDLLLLLAQAASRIIDSFTGRHFYPKRATQHYSYTNPSYLLLINDLLTIHNLTNGDGTLITAYHLHPANDPIKSSIMLDRGVVVFTYLSDPIDAITLDATWGFHPDWDHAWEMSGASVQDNPLSASATTLTVSDADAAFSPGQLLRLDDEYVQVLAVDPVDNTLTISRGANGTTAASHPQTTPISIYLPPADIQQTGLRVASWLYKQKDAGFVQIASTLRGQIAVPPALPDDVQQILAPYIRVVVL